MWSYDKKAVGERVRSQRKACNLTQEALAERIDRSVKYCADVERGTTGMSIESMLLFCEVLKMSPNMLLLGDDTRAEKSDVLSAETLLLRCTPAQREQACEILRILLKFYE